jgi:hypothetical protein
MNKFNIGTKVWFISGNEVQNKAIMGIFCNRNYSDPLKYIEYFFDTPDWESKIPFPRIEQNRVFASKEELLNSL